MELPYVETCFPLLTFAGGLRYETAVEPLNNPPTHTRELEADRF